MADTKNNLSGLARLGVIVAVGVGALIIVSSGIYSVDQGQEAILLNFGKISGTETAGLHFKVPFVQNVTYIDLQSHTAVYDDPPLESYSRDQQPANLQVSINYHVPPDAGADLYARYGDADRMKLRIIDQQLPATLKDIFGTYDAQTAIQQRAKLNADVLAAMKAATEGQPLVVESVQIKDIKFSADYEAAIAAKQQATVKVQEQQQLLDQEKIKAQIVATTAQGQADAVVNQAKAQAQAVQLQADAEAHAIQVKGDAEAAVIKSKGAALRDNPGLVELTKAERWDGVLPTSMIPSTAVPFLEVQQGATTAP